MSGTAMGRTRSFIVAAALLTALGIAGCRREAAAPATTPVTFHAQGLPKQLSEWHVLVSDGQHLRLNAGVEPYALNTALFSDYAHKLRAIWLPKGGQARYDATDLFVGSHHIPAA